MKHFYHGLFGAPADWQGLITQGPDVIFHDLYNEKELLKIKTCPDDVLVGYSMGGRIALEIAQRNKFNLKHLILLSTHPGIEEVERDERILFENNIIFKMQSLTAAEFTDFWNSLPIFSSSRMEDLSAEKLKKSSSLFKQYRSSGMKTDRALLKKHHKKITWMIGRQDEKYCRLIEERVLPLGITTLRVGTDHRVLEAKDELRDLFIKKGIQ